MRLSKARIRGFRSIKEQTINFDIGCQILVGINEAGKTNLLKALRLLDKGSVPSIKDRRRPLEGESYEMPMDIYFDLELSPVERLQYQKAMLAKVLTKSNDTPLCVYAGNEKTLAEYTECHSIPLYWIDLKTSKKHFSGYSRRPSTIVEGWFKRKPSSPTLNITDAAGRTKPIDAYTIVYAPHFPEVPMTHLEPLTLDNISHLFTSVFSDLFEKDLPACIYWTYEEKYLLPSSIGLGEFSLDPSSCVPLQHMFFLAGIADIKAAVEQERALGASALRNLLERVASRTTKHVKSIWKEYKNLDIKLELNGDAVDASVVDHFNRYDFVDRSDGFKRFISLLLVLSAQARTEKLKNSLILLDEAEIGLHPSGVRYLRDELINLAKTNHVVVSTHSIFMIDKDCVERHLIVKKGKETTECSRANTTNVFEEEVLYNALNYSVFETLRDFNVLFEGWRDKRLFNAALKDKRCPEGARERFKEIGQCHLQGVNDAGRVVPLLELGERGYVVVSDSDEAAVRAQERFRGSGAWLLYSDLGASAKVFLTSEDFICASAFEGALKKLAVAAGVPQLTLNDDAKRKPRTALLRSWLQSALQLEGDALKEAMNAIKEDVSNQLKPSHILDDYFDVISSMLSKCPPATVGEPG